MGDIALAHQQRRRRNPASRRGDRAGVGRQRAVPRGDDRHAGVARLAPVPADDRGRARQPVGARCAIGGGSKRRSPSLRQRSADIGSFLIETLQGVQLVVTSNAQARETGAVRGPQPRLRRRADVDAG